MMLVLFVFADADGTMTFNDVIPADQVPCAGATWKCDIKPDDAILNYKANPEYTYHTKTNIFLMFERFVA